MPRRIQPMLRRLNWCYSLDHGSISPMHRPVQFSYRRFKWSPFFYCHLSKSLLRSFVHPKYILSVGFRFNLDTLTAIWIIGLDSIHRI
jgi:hypothetical protein